MIMMEILERSDVIKDTFMGHILILFRNGWNSHIYMSSLQFQNINVSFGEN